MLIQFQDHVTKYSQTDEPPNTSQYTRPQITKQRWTNRTDNEYRYYSRNDQFQIFKRFMLFTSDSKNGPTKTNALILVLGRQLTTSVKSKQISAKPVISQNQGNNELTNSKRKHIRSSECFTSRGTNIQIKDSLPKHFTFIQISLEIRSICHLRVINFLLVSLVETATSDWRDIDSFEIRCTYVYFRHTMLFQF